MFFDAEALPRLNQDSEPASSCVDSCSQKLDSSNESCAPRATRTRACARFLVLFVKNRDYDHEQINDDGMDAVGVIDDDASQDSFCSCVESESVE